MRCVQVVVCLSSSSSSCSCFAISLLVIHAAVFPCCLHLPRFQKKAWSKHSMSLLIQVKLLSWLKPFWYESAGAREARRIWSRRPVRGEESRDSMRCLVMAFDRKSSRRYSEKVNPGVKIVNMKKGQSELVIEPCILKSTASGGFTVHGDLQMDDRHPREGRRSPCSRRRTRPNSWRTWCARPDEDALVVTYGLCFQKYDTGQYISLASW